jgi:hypothetical protein
MQANVTPAIVMNPKAKMGASACHRMTMASHDALEDPSQRDDPCPKF